MQRKITNFDFAKNFVKEQVLRQVLAYLEKDPEASLPRIFKLVKLFAIKKEHKEQVEQLALAYQQNPASRTYINRLFVATHPNVKHRLLYNWFINFAIDNIKEKNLLEILQSPLFAAYQKRQPFSENHLRPCPIIDNPDALRAIVAESGARPTHPGAETVLDGPVAKSLDRKAENWAAVCDGIWEERRARRQAQSRMPVL